MKYVAQFLRPHLDSKSFPFDTLLLGYPEKKFTKMKMLYMHHIIPNQYIILVAVYIAGRSLQIVEATEPPNFASVPILLHLL